MELRVVVTLPTTDMVIGKLRSVTCNEGILVYDEKVQHHSLVKGQQLQDLIFTVKLKGCFDQEKRYHDFLTESFTVNDPKVELALDVCIKPKGIRVELCKKVRKRR